MRLNDNRIWDGNLRWTFVVFTVRTLGLHWERVPRGVQFREERVYMVQEF